MKAFDYSNDIRKLNARVELADAKRRERMTGRIQPVYTADASLSAIAERAQSNRKPVYFRFAVSAGVVYATEYMPNPETDAYYVESEPWQREDATVTGTQLPRKVTADALLLAVEAFEALAASIGDAAIVGIQPVHGQFRIRLLSVCPRPAVLPTGTRLDR